MSAATEARRPASTSTSSACAGLSRSCNSRATAEPLVFLDSAASAQKPRQVIDAMSEFYRRDYANIHRGVYELSQRATEAFEGARDKVRDFLNAAESREIVFVRGTTEAINLVASTYGAPERRSRRRDPHHRHGAPLEHRSVAAAVRREGRVLRVAPIDDRGELMMDEFEKLLSPRTRWSR